MRNSVCIHKSTSATTMQIFIRYIAGDIGRRDKPGFEIRFGDIIPLNNSFLIIKQKGKRTM
jgi:hypothetical protein